MTREYMSIGGPLEHNCLVILCAILVTNALSFFLTADQLLCYIYL